MTGMFGGFGHCIGMCGPIVAARVLTQQAGERSYWTRLMPSLLYNGGRVTTYTLIGGLMGLSGSFANVAGRLSNVQNLAAISAGIIMIAMGLSILGIWRGTTVIEKHNSAVMRLASRVIASTSSVRPYLLGLVLGLLPCGLSYTIFIAAAGTGGVVPGTLIALLFGAGTLPALLLFGAIVSSLSAAFRGRIYRAGGVLVMLMGTYYVYQGIGLYVRL